MAITKEVSKNNPANEKPVLPRGYRPMSGGQRRLEVPDLEGYRLYWFRDDPGRVEEAQLAGYTFVDRAEITTTSFDVAGDGGDDKGSDMGTRVSKVQGGGAIHPNGQPGRLYLMKCPNDIAEYAQSLMDQKVDAVAEALRGGRMGGKTEQGKTYHEVDAPLLKRKT